MGVPRHPVHTECDHVFCDSCINAWLKNAGACPCCRSVLNSVDIESLKGPLFKVYSLIKVKCVFSCVGCPKVLTIQSREAHENWCPARLGKGIPRKKKCSEVAILLKSH